MQNPPWFFLCGNDKPIEIFGCLSGIRLWRHQPEQNSHMRFAEIVYHVALYSASLFLIFGDLTQYMDFQHPGLDNLSTDQREQKIPFRIPARLLWGPHPQGGMG